MYFGLQFLVIWDMVSWIYHFRACSSPIVHHGGSQWKSQNTLIMSRKQKRRTRGWDPVFILRAHPPRLDAISLYPASDILLHFSIITGWVLTHQDKGSFHHGHHSTSKSERIIVFLFLWLIIFQYLLTCKYST